MKHHREVNYIYSIDNKSKHGALSDARGAVVLLHLLNRPVVKQPWRRHRCGEKEGGFANKQVYAANEIPKRFVHRQAV